MKIQLKNTGLLAVLLLLVVSCNTPPDPPAPNTAAGQGVVIGEDLGQPKVSRVDLEDIEGNQVRQGHGNLILDIEGKSLANINQAWLELSQADMPLGAPKTIPLDILHKADTQAQLQTEVQHGALTGNYILVVQADKVGKKYDAVVVTAITSSPSGDDVSGMGTPHNPFRSLTKAVSLSTSADKIFLEIGSYDNANGEVFPIDVSGLNIAGSGPNESILSGAGVAETNPCLVVMPGKAETRLSDLKVSHCVGDGIRLYHGKTHLNRVHVLYGQSNGLHLLGSAQATVEASGFGYNLGNGMMAGDSTQLELIGDRDPGDGYITSVSTTQNGQSSLYLTGNAKVSGYKLFFGGNQGIRINGAGVMASLHTGSIATIEPGILIENAQKVDLDGVEVLGGNSHCVEVSGSADLTMSNARLINCDEDGIHVDVSANETAVLKLVGLNIAATGQSGIEFRSDNPASKLTLTGSKIKNNGTYGLYIAGVPSTIVLGSDFRPGNNQFFDNGSTYLVDARNAGSGTISAQGNTFATAGVVTPISGLKFGPASQLPFWQIVNAGNTINFGSR